MYAVEPAMFALSAGGGALFRRGGADFIPGIILAARK